MRFLTTILFLFLGITAYAAEAGLSQAAVPDGPVEARDASVQEAAVTERDASVDEAAAVGLLTSRELIEKRTCSYNGCKCSSRGYQFHSCGNCYWTDTGAWAISKKRVSTHIYECGPTGTCCDYGTASDCGTSSARCFIRD